LQLFSALKFNRFFPILLLNFSKVQANRRLESQLLAQNLRFVILQKEVSTATLSSRVAIDFRTIASLLKSRKVWLDHDRSCDFTM